MPEENIVKSLRDKYNLSNPRKRETLSPEEKTFLRDNSIKHKEILEGGKRFLNITAKFFGGSPNPHRPLTD